MCAQKVNEERAKQKDAFSKNTFIGECGRFSTIKEFSEKNNIKFTPQKNLSISATTNDEKPKQYVLN
jgi:hypothetical protein